MTEITIETHDGQTFQTSVKEYDPVGLNKLLNDNEILTLVIGDIVISRINVKVVLPKDMSGVV